MGRKYKARFAAQNLPATAAFGVFELKVAATCIVKLLSFFVEQSGTTDFGDAQAEGVPIEITRVSSAGTSGGGTAITPSKVESGDPAASSVVKTASIVTGGTQTIIESRAFNVQLGQQYTPTPEEQDVFSPGEFLQITIPVGPLDAIPTVYATLVFEEVGG
jgi:hypothetical protein